MQPTGALKKEFADAWERHRKEKSRKKRRKKKKTLDKVKTFGYTISVIV